MSIANDQILKCKENGCIECSDCIGAFYSKYDHKPEPYKKEKKIQVNHNANEWDFLAQNAINKTYKPHNHPLYDYIIEKFTKG